MMQFQLRIQGASGPSDVQQVTVNASTELDALRTAAKNGWRVVSIENPAVIEIQATGAGHKFPLLQFSQELLALLEAGLNLTEAITTLHNKESRPGSKSTLGGI